MRRICDELFGFYGLETLHPIRITKSKLVQEGELERAVRLAAIQNNERGPIVIVLDADGDCPAELGSELFQRASRCGEGLSVAVIVAKTEFEAWFLAAAESLSGRRTPRGPSASTRS